MSHSEMVMEMIQRGQFSISRKHIEDLRPWRGILLPHARQALQSGSVISCSQSSAILRGSDSDGRILELPLKPLSLEFRIQNSWTNAELVHVMTA